MPEPRTAPDAPPQDRPAAPGPAATAGRWRIEVDRNVCAGTGLCLGTASRHMRLDNGRARPVAEVVDPDPSVADAADTCPMEAITVRDAATGEVLAPER
ncbi:ferredoxin [Streptomyces mobaraensis]|uniref:Ferredoxin n=1 Tax=Streptomyces mobaraensis TaxID=35621 RepID=A0A5N5VYA7_STRMB|nr:ferredoxin [Streptomyces mobaraensis]KAB7833782.1 ferredoxin [Streptomyces mobaraensis]